MCPILPPAEMSFHWAAISRNSSATVPDGHSTHQRPEGHRLPPAASDRSGTIHRQADRAVQTFADQAVIAIENARLFDEVQARTRELTQSVEELRALGEVSQAVNSTARPADGVGHHHRQGDPALRHRCRSNLRV